MARLGQPRLQTKTHRLLELESLAFANIYVVNRPTRFEEFQYLGDKRTQIVYDLDAVDDDEVMATITQCVAEGKAIAFGPDSLAEARNRGYRLLCS